MAYRVAPEAESDLDDIWLYVARASSSIEIADRLIDSITTRFFLLARNPLLGRARDQDLRSGLRSFPVRDYLILYRTEADGVLILRVLHGSRDLQALLKGS